jgi:hypothetical protein
MLGGVGSIGLDMARLASLTFFLSLWTLPLSNQTRVSWSGQLHTGQRFPGVFTFRLGVLHRGHIHISAGRADGAGVKSVPVLEEAAMARADVILGASGIVWQVHVYKD